MRVFTKSSAADIYCIHCGLTWDMHIADGKNSCPNLPALYTVTKCSQCGMDIDRIRENGCEESRGGCGRRKIPGYARSRV